MDYLVSWQIHIDAETPEEAANQALKIQRDDNSEAVFFDVKDPATDVSYDIQATPLRASSIDIREFTDRLQQTGAVSVGEAVHILTSKFRISKDRASAYVLGII